MFRMSALKLVCVSALWILAAPLQAQVFTDTGANGCSGAIIITLPVGPVGSPTTITIHGDNSGATLPDCAPPQGIHAGPVWWEAIRLETRAQVTIDLCGTSPEQIPSYDLIYGSCGTVPNQPCGDPKRNSTSGRGGPFCSDGNLWATFQNLTPGVYRVPILSDPAVLANGLGPYTMHVHSSACPGACCRFDTQSCEDCIDAATCNGPSDVFHDGESCFQARCFLPDGPDLITGLIQDCTHLGRVGDIGSGVVAMSCGTSACNQGNARGNWIGLPNTDHPLIGMNLYRLRAVEGTNRLEQIGQSWLKHGFGSANADECGFGCEPGVELEEIGIGCSDPYNALQFTSCNLGPRSMLHPYTGAMPEGPAFGPQPDCEIGSTDGINYPSNDHRDHVHTPVSHKTQVQETDLSPVLHPGARYFAEGFYIAPHEFNLGNGNQNNNYSHVELVISEPDPEGVYSYSEVSATYTESPAIDSWPGSSSAVLEPYPLTDGRAILAWEVTDLGGGQWHYEYGLFNMNMDASVESFCLPIPPGISISNVGFHAPANHDSEPNVPGYSNQPWVSTVTTSTIRWDTERFSVDPNANAVRFGTLYNFRFDADAPPESMAGVVGLFKTSGQVALDIQGPGAVQWSDANLNKIPDVCEPIVPANLQVDAGPAKPRFISFEVPVTGDNPETALRVRLNSLHHVVPPYTGGPSVPFASFEGQVRWVGPPVEYVESSASQIPFYASSLQCTPHYQDWSTVGLLHVTGSAVVPSSEFEIENVAASCLGAEETCTAVSAPLAIGTTRWADVEVPFNPPDPTAQPNASDIGALVNKFRGALGAPIKARALLTGSDQFGNISIAPDFSFIHIASCVDAFRGLPYPFTIEACP